MNIKDDYILKNIHEGYLVGGAVRDFLLDKEVNDRDIAVIGAEEFAHKLAEQFDAVFVTLDSENKIYRLVLRNSKDYIDVSELRAVTIEEDLRMRDFTINSIAYDLKNNEFVDVTGGIEDIKNGILRCAREENFTDDPLRVLRAFRFMSVTGFKFSNELEAQLRKYYKLLKYPAKERVHDEIMKLFGGKYASYTLLKMDEIGILEMIFPCINEFKKVPPNTHHHLDLFHHSVETVKQIEILYENLEKEPKEIINKVSFGDYPRINNLKISGFLHDIGKFSTWTIEEGGRHRFIKHDNVGAKLVVPLLKNLKFSNKQIEYISLMIQKHIYPSSVISAPNLDKKVLMRYIRKMEEYSVDNILLAKADRLSARGREITEEILNENLSGLDKLMNFYLNNKELLTPLPKLLDGREIMEIKNIGQSPLLGQIIKDLKEAQINGDINTKEEAEEFVKNY